MTHSFFCHHFSKKKFTFYFQFSRLLVQFPRFSQQNTENSGRKAVKRKPCGNLRINEYLNSFCKSFSNKMEILLFHRYNSIFYNIYNIIAIQNNPGLLKRHISFFVYKVSIYRSFISYTNILN